MTDFKRVCSFNMFEYELIHSFVVNMCIILRYNISKIIIRILTPYLILLQKK